MRMLQKEPSSYWRIWQTSDYGQEMEIKVVWPHLNVFPLSKDGSAGHSDIKENKKYTEEKIGTQ